MVYMNTLTHTELLLRTPWSPKSYKKTRPCPCPPISKAMYIHFLHIEGGSNHVYSVICVYLTPLPPPLSLIISHYNTSSVNPTHQYHDTRALEGVWRAMWQVGLALVAKAVLCIFTFGIKVLHHSHTHTQ